MRVLHVVSLFSPDGAFGGPVRVATNLCVELIRQGHDARLAGGYRGYPTAPADVEGVPAHLLPARRALPRVGFAGLTAPGLARWVRREAPSYDVVHVHLTRDLVTLPAARAVLGAGVPLVVQTHGMIDPSDHPLARPLDRFWTRPVLRRARAVLYLTALERDQLLAVEPRLTHLHELPNGVPEPPAAATVAEVRRREVLFLARLHPRKNPIHFVQAANALARRHPDWCFTLVGPDEGEGHRVRAMIKQGNSDAVTWEGAVAPQQVLARMSRAAIYALPSRDEPFALSVLEAMSLGLPVVVTNTCGLAPEVDAAQAGIVTNGTPAALQRALERLIDDDMLREVMGRASRSVAQRRFSITAVTGNLVRVYRTATAEG